MTRIALRGLVPCLLLLALAARPALAQCITCDPGGGEDNVAPTITMPAGGWNTSGSATVTIEYRDDVEVGGPLIRLNGTDVRSLFTVSYSGGTPPTYATATGTISFTPGSNTLWTRICDGSNNCREDSATFNYDHANPTVSISPSHAIVGGSPITLTVSWGDNWSLNPNSITITRQGDPVTWLTYSGTATSATSSGPLWLSHGANAIYAAICDHAGRCTSSTTNITYDPHPPAVSISPGTHTTSSASTSVTISWSDNLDLNAGSRVIQLNGSSVTGSFNWSGGGTSATSSWTAVPLNPGTNTLYAYICDTAGHCSSQTVTYTRPHTYTVAVTPDGGSASIVAGESGTFAFNVVNQGNTGTTYTFTASCTGSGAAGCSASPGSSFLGPGSGTTVTVDYGTTYGGDTVAIHLQASGSGASDAGSATVTLTYPAGSPAPPIIAGAYPRAEVIDRASCLDIGVSEASAASCGDLRIVHPLPVIRSMNKIFSPALVYSAVATDSAVAILPVDVMVPAGAGQPDLVTASLEVGGASPQERTWSGSHFAPGMAVRIAAPHNTNATGIFSYQFTVAGIYGTEPQVGDTNTGTLIHVSRHDSPFGSGWWLAGLEQLHYPGQSEMLWVGGDGSARIYRAVVSDSIWKGVNRARPDSIIKVGSEYHRIVPGGSTVRFDGAGRHTGTRDRNGHVTAFSYDTSGRLDRITLPTAGATAPYYEFSYGSGGLTSVEARAGGGIRTTQVAISGGRITSITDPGPTGTATTFGYDGSSRVIRTREVQGGSRTDFVLNGARHVELVRRYMDAAAFIETTLRHHESIGVDDSGEHVPAPSGQIHTRIDGPRTDVADITRFYLNAHSEPDSVEDALGNRTRVLARDPGFPALVTHVKEPNGREVMATYTGARVATIVDYGTTDGTAYATTTYDWSTSCPDFPQKITKPEGDFIEYGYGANCNRVWQQDARGASSRVEYGYNASGQLTAVNPPSSRETTFGYHAGTGNLTSITRFPGWTDLVGVTQSVHRDAWGADSVVVTPVTGSTSKVSRYYYDAMGRDTLTIEEASGSAIKAWKTYEAGRLRFVTTLTDPDPNGIGTVTHEYSYDRLGRLESDIGGGTAVHYVYDEAGNLVDGGPRPAVRTYASNNLLATEGSSTFEYDASGNLLRADNEFARIRRGLDPAGRITTDTLWIAQFDASTRQPNGFSGSSHVYVIRYGYDLNGRPIWQQHSSNLAPGSSQDSISYAYTGAGFLDRAVDIVGNAYEFTYDGEGRPRSLTRAFAAGGSVRDTMAYDALARLDFRRILSSSAGLLLHEDPGYDHLDRMISSGQTGESYEYHALGPIIQGLAGSSESFSTDVLGRRTSSNSKIGQYPALTNYVYQSGAGTLAMTEHVGMQTDTTTFQFNSLGQQQYQERRQRVNGNTWSVEDTVLVTRTDHAYNGRLQLVRTIFTADTIPMPYIQYAPYRSEEGHWYDALGRRVLVWSWRQSNCPNKDPASGCLSTVTRTMWAGNQIAYEIRAPWSSPDSDNSTGAHYGRVGYLHLGGIDQPVALWKGTIVVHPHLNARGVYRIATCGTALCSSSTIDVPGNRLSLFGADRNPPPNGPVSWFGSLITGQIDASGMLYRRNRYVDPRNGTFTQADPIGIAGGLNIFGYANGDPVTFSDPFGLCAKDKDGNEDPECRATIIMLQRLARADGTSDQARKELNGAIDFYEALDVDLAWHYLPDNAECCDTSDPDRRFRGGGARGQFIWINSATSQADMALTAWHEAQHAIHGRGLAGSHTIIYPLQARIYTGLSGWARTEAEQTRRLLKARGVLP